MNNIRLLMAKIAAGDKEALKEYISLFGGGIKAAAFRVLNDKALCDDVLSEVIYKVWEKAEKLKNLKNINGYIYTIAYNSAVDIKRKQKEIFFDDEKISFFSKSEDIGGEKLFIEEIMQKMEEELRSVLILKAGCGYSFFEIAKIKDISYKKARSLYIKACAKFKKMYEDNG